VFVGTAELEEQVDQGRGLAGERMGEQLARSRQTAAEERSNKNKNNNNNKHNMVRQTLQTRMV
jgi:hypothetical protein